MATNAQRGRVELRRRHVAGIVGVLCLRTMTGFAMYGGVFTCLLGVGHVGVTGFARLLACVVKGVSGNLSNGCGAVVAIFAEGGRDYKTSDRPKH